MGVLVLPTALPLSYDASPPTAIPIIVPWRPPAPPPLPAVVVVVVVFRLPPRLLALHAYRLGYPPKYCMRTPRGRSRYSTKRKSRLNSWYRSFNPHVFVTG